MKLNLISRTLILLPLVIGACAPAVVKPTDTMMEKPTEAMMEKPTDDMMAKPTEAMMEKPTDDMMAKPTEAMMEKPTDDMMAKPTEAMMEKSTDAMMETPKWFTASFTNVADGKPFSITDFKGKVVLVEAMAQWCPTCKKQQQQILEFEKTMGNNPDLVVVTLDVDPNENASDLKKYIESNGFTWIYAVAPAEVSNELAKLYGNQFLNPPSTPMLVIDHKGGVTVLPLGTVKSAGDLQQAIEPLLKAGM